MKRLYYISLFCALAFLSNDFLHAKSRISKFGKNRVSKPKIAVGLEFQYLFAEIEGKSKFTKNSNKGTKFSFSDLGLRDKEDIPSLHFYIGSINHQIHLEYTEYSLSGSQIIDKNISISNTNYSSGDKLNTDMEATWGKFYYEYWANQGGARYGVLFGVEKYTFEFDIQRNSSNNTSKSKLDTYQPLIGSHFIVGKGKYLLKAAIFYVPAILNNTSDETLDASLSFQFNFGQYSSIEGGYRYIDSQVEDNSGDKETDFEIQGFFAQISIKY